MKRGEVLILRSFKTGAKRKDKNTKELYKITSLNAFVGDRIDSQNCPQESAIL